jgi:hypothetical protein
MLTGEPKATHANDSLGVVDGECMTCDMDRVDYCMINLC